MASKLNEDRNALVEEYREYVEAIVSRLIQKMNLPHNMRDEFVSAGYLGLVEAAERFDGTRGAQFKSYAFLRIRGAIIDTMRRGLDISDRAYRYLRSLEASNFLREAELLNPDREKLENEPRRKLARALEYLSSSAMCHRLIAVCSSQEKEEADMLVQGGTPEDELHQIRESTRIRKIIDRLPEKEQRILKEYYFEERAFTDIASDEVGLSKSWVSRLHTRAIKLLREQYIQETEVRHAEAL